MFLCEIPDGFVLLSSINHRRFSVFIYSAKYKFRVYRLGGRCNLIIYSSNIN